MGFDLMKNLIIYSNQKNDSHRVNLRPGADRTCGVMDSALRNKSTDRGIKSEQGRRAFLSSPSSIYSMPIQFHSMTVYSHKCGT